MANLIMTNWYIEDTTPPIVIGTAGENNATPISIQCDSVIANAEYFLDIGDEKDGLPNTQELTVEQQEIAGETINVLYLKPMRSFLGKEGIKLLQVRCETPDGETYESNVFHAIVDRNSGFIYKYDIAVFQQYLNKVKDIVKKVTNTLVGLDDVNITNPTDGQVVKYDATSQKWVNGSGGEGSLQNVIDSPTSGNTGGVVEGATREIENYSLDTSIVTITPNQASGDFSHAEGISYNNHINIASGIGSHAEGNSTTASGRYSHAEGNDTIASGIKSHAEGYYTTASGESSHTEGYNTKAVKSYSHAEGLSTTANGKNSHAEGSGTTASGDNSHAEGLDTSSGYASHAEGYRTTASGNGAHAEGHQTTASGDYSHTEGQLTNASGNYSHAEGDSTNASGINSHAQNNNTIAKGQSQTVIGKYNVAQGTVNSIANTDYAFIIGNGTGNYSRSNAFAIKWDGTFVFADGTEITPAEFAQLKALLN